MIVLHHIRVFLVGIIFLPLRCVGFGREAFGIIAYGLYLVAHFGKARGNRLVGVVLVLAEVGFGVFGKHGYCLFGEVCGVLLFEA